jgi:hypothetical protein
MLYKIFKFSTLGNWRALLFWSAIPCFLALVLTLFFLDESPRYLLLNNKFEEGIKLITKMGVTNLGENFKSLTETERMSLKKWADRLSNEQSKGRGNYLELLKGKRKRLSPLLWLSWFVLTTVYYVILNFLSFFNLK